jgi:hypothetical protein
MPKRGFLPIDNNAAERSIKPFVIGRKAWLFSDTPKGATASAQVYGLAKTAKLNGNRSITWLRHVMERLPYASSVDDYEALVPWNCSRGAPHRPSRRPPPTEKGLPHLPLDCGRRAVTKVAWCPEAWRHSHRQYFSALELGMQLVRMHSSEPEASPRHCRYLPKLAHRRLGKPKVASLH